MSKKLPVMETFYSIQGEGYHQGRASFFVRLAGCDVGCVWCDVKESWEEEGHPLFTEEEILETISVAPKGIVIITGGEPLMHDLTSLTDKIRSIGYQTHIETSGAHPLSGKWDWVCWSPKKFKEPVSGFAEQANELKIIVFNRHDFEWAETFVEQVSDDCKLYLQPEWGKEPEILPQIINYVKDNPKWNISLQTHKYMNVQ